MATSRLSLAGILVVAALLVGCSKYSGPYHQCLASHQQMTMQPVIIGKVTTLQPRYHTVCDKESKELYIKVDKITYRVEEAWKEN